MVLAPLLAPLIDVFLLYGLVFGPTQKTVVAWLGVLAVQAVCAAYAGLLAAGEGGGPVVVRQALQLPRPDRGPALSLAHR